MDQFWIDLPCECILSFASSVSARLTKIRLAHCARQGYVETAVLSVMDANRLFAQSILTKTGISVANVSSCLWNATKRMNGWKHMTGVKS